MHIEGVDTPTMMVYYAIKSQNATEQKNSVEKYQGQYWNRLERKRSH